MRTRLFAAALAAAGLTSCSPAPAPPAIAAVPVAASTPTEPATPPAAPAPAEAKKDEAPLKDGGSFAFPDDTGGKALSKTLIPAAPPPMPAAAPPAPRERKLPAFLDAPEPPLPDAANTPPRLALPPVKEPRPTALPERVPPDLGSSIADLPPRPESPVGSPARVAAADLTRPAPLPVLAPKPVADRAPLADPTAEFTAASVISPTLPLRTEPAGFVRINLPDPFENAGTGKPLTPVEENPNRALPRQ
jgi:hypothetical protein